MIRRLPIYWTICDKSTTLLRKLPSERAHRLSILAGKYNLSI